MNDERKNQEESWKQEFSASEDLQVEFGGSVEAYVAFRRAEDQGRVRDLKSSVVDSGSSLGR